MAISRDELFKKVQLQSEEVEIPGVGSVLVRGLTRTEALGVNNKEMTVLEMEQLLMSMAVVEPELSKDDVKQLQDTLPAGALEDVTDAITRLSGMEKSTHKETMKRFRG